MIIEEIREPGLEMLVVSWCCGQVQSPDDVIQKIEKTLNYTHKLTQKQTKNSFHNTRKDLKCWTLLSLFP